MSVDTAGMLEHHVRDSFCSLGCHGQMDHELVFGWKITEKTVRRWYARSVQGASINSRHSGYVASVLRVYREAQGRHRIEMAIRLQQQPFRHIPEVQQWPSQYNHVTDRYKFFVLDGTSRAGRIR